MRIGSVSFKNYSCFRDQWAGFGKVTPISVIIGKNNTGKSHLLNFTQALCKEQIGKINRDLQVEVVFDQATLQQIFPLNRYGGDLGGDHWQNHGRLFVDKTGIWKKEAGKIESLTFSDESFFRDGVQHHVAEARVGTIKSKLALANHPLHNRNFKHLLADRDIQPEPSSNDLKLSPDGKGATNIVRRFINSTDSRFKRELIQVDMLKALNLIFSKDAEFQEIAIRHHDGSTVNKVEDKWEIFLKEEHKGLISLSNSGSGLKTIFLVLLNILVIPHIEGKQLSTYVFAFEELENNLHPSLLRNLLGFIRDQTTPNENSTSGAIPHFFLTTHSNVTLDYFTGHSDAQIVHVNHDGRSARTRIIDQSINLLGILWDLGTRPSDLLQANGIIWVEGPSDRIYLNKWIELFSNGKFKEGRHYQCAFYGGALLANLQATGEEEASKELINILKINPNTIVVSDSDKATKRGRLKIRVQRIRDEFSKLEKARSLHWILSAREIENYLTGESIGRILTTPRLGLSSPGQYQRFFPKAGETSYLETTIGRKSFHKSELAALVSSKMELRDLQDRFDLKSMMERVLGIIDTWNE